jgi:hypothetical protein
MDDYSKRRITLNEEISIAFYHWDHTENELSIEGDVGGCHFCSGTNIDIAITKEKAVELIEILNGFLTPKD